MKNKNQKGATLITSLLMLIIMTVVGVSAVKVSSMDIIVAGNDQQQMMLFQTTSSKLVKLATSVKLLPALVGGVDLDHPYTVPDAMDNDVEKIKDMKLEYSCSGVNGKANSLGGSSTPPCRMYEFQISTTSKVGGAHEKLRRGAGKLVPNKENPLEN